MVKNIENINSEIMWLSKLTPKKFLWRFPLHTGALFIGFCTLAIAIICVIVVTVEIVYYKECKDCTVLVMHNAYSFSINALVYCIIMIFVNSWFIWGVKNGKSSVVLSWVVISTLWWAQSSLLVFILMCMYVTDTSLAWIVALACSIIAFMIFGYFILVVYGHWLAIRKSSEPRVEEPSVQ